MSAALETPSNFDHSSIPITQEVDSSNRVAAADITLDKLQPRLDKIVADATRLAEGDDASYKGYVRAYLDLELKLYAANDPAVALIQLWARTQGIERIIITTAA